MHAPADTTAAEEQLADLAGRITRSIEHEVDAWWVANRDALAVELWAAQRAAVPAYGAWSAHELASRGAVGGPPAAVRSIGDVPALPIAAFKQLEVRAPRLADAACWELSGTTGGARPSRHHLHDVAAYEASLDAGVARALLPDVVAGRRGRIRCVQLQPDARAAGASSLTHMFDRVRTGPWCRDAGAYVSGSYRVDAAGAWRALAGCVEAREPVLVLATSFALVELLERTAGEPALALPAGSRVIDTGGYKGRTRELTRDELVAEVGARLGVGAAWCENEYGMSELSSQAWLGTVSRAATGAPIDASAPDAPRWTPPWLVVRVVDPVTLVEVPDGGEGLLVFHDLANAWSCGAVRSEDIGVRRGSSFELVGRAPGAVMKGCSLRLEQLAGDD